MNRTDEQKATDYTNMSCSVTVINNLIAVFAVKSALTFVIF